MFLDKILFKLGPVWNATLNPNFSVSFFIFGPIFGIQGKVIVYILLMLLLLLLLVPCVFVLKLLIIFCNVFLSCPFSQNISVRCSIAALKYFSEQIFVALARNSLIMLVIVSGGTFCTFVRAGLRWTSTSYLPLLFFYFYVQRVQIFFFIFIFYAKLNVFVLFLQNALKFVRLFLRCQLRLNIINISPIRFCFCLYVALYFDLFENGFNQYGRNITFSIAKLV